MTAIAYGRYPAREVVAALANLGFHVSTATLAQWKCRGHLSPGRGYDLDEVAARVRARHAVRSG